MAKAKVISIQQEGIGNLLTDHLWDLGELLRVKSHIFNELGPHAILVVKADVERLGTVDLISVLAGLLSNSVFSDLTILGLVLSSDLVATLGLKPVLGPSAQIFGIRHESLVT